jgi:RimJ/RimL family protein N-acetyltransferase
MPRDRYRIDWAEPDGPLAVVEPTPDEVAAAAPALAAAYSEPHNRAMMAGTTDMTAGEVMDHFAALDAAGGRPFLLFHEGALAGDADLRRIEHGRAEVAILIAARAAQGRGLGTRFARMIHALAFGPLGLERTFVTIVPANAASLRLFEKLGYARDDGPEARAYADDADDVSLSLSRDAFGPVAAGIRITRR